MNNATALSWGIAIFLAYGAWIVAVDWLVVRVTRAWHHHKITARMDAVLGRQR